MDEIFIEWRYEWMMNRESVANESTAEKALCTRVNMEVGKENRSRERKRPDWRNWIWRNDATRSTRLERHRPNLWKITGDWIELTQAKRKNAVTLHHFLQRPNKKVNISATIKQQLTNDPKTTAVTKTTGIKTKHIKRLNRNYHFIKTSNQPISTSNQMK